MHFDHVSFNASGQHYRFNNTPAQNNLEQHPAVLITSQVTHNHGGPARVAATPQTLWQTPPQLLCTPAKHH
jgi:hypothetical protein